MSDTPFMPLWVADFLADTMDLGAKEVGAYMLLLMALWSRDGYLPADQKKLQRVARCGRDWPKIWDALQGYFQTDGERIWNRRLLEEATKVAAKRAVNAHSGARGGRAKALNRKEAGLANATNSLYQPEPYPESEKKEETSNEVSARAKADPQEFEAIWKAYPRKVGKGAAAKQWAKARRSHSFEEIARPLAEFCRLREGGDQQFTPHLATWLHQERWNDEQGHAVNRRPNSSEDIERLSRIPADDVDRLFQGIPQLRLIGQ